MVNATAIAMSYLYFGGMAPSANAALSNATKVFHASLALDPSFGSFLIFVVSYMCNLLSVMNDRVILGPACHDTAIDIPNGAGDPCCIIAQI